MAKEKELGELISMSLGDHLEELRLRMLLAIAGILLGLIVCLCFGSHLIRLLAAPYNKAMASVQKSQQEEREQSDQDDQLRMNVAFQLSDGQRFPASIQVKHLKQMLEQEKDVPDPNALQGGQTDILIWLPDGRSISAMVSLDELKQLKDPQQSDKTMNVSGWGIKGLQTIEPAEGFLVYIKISLAFGLILVSPWVFWQAWSFVSAGLYKHEQKFVHVVTPISAGLFVVGSMFFLLFVAPLAMTFFMNFNQALMLDSHWTFKSYVNMVLTLTLVFGLAFQMPIAIVFAERMGLVSVKMLESGRKYVIVILTVVAAMATPPDVISQISLFIPMYGLFEGGVLACKVLGRKKAQSEEIDDSQEDFDDYYEDGSEISGD